MTCCSRLNTPRRRDAQHLIDGLVVASSLFCRMEIGWYWKNNGLLNTVPRDNRWNHVNRSTLVPGDLCTD